MNLLQLLASASLMVLAFSCGSDRSSSDLLNDDRVVCKGKVEYFSIAYNSGMKAEKDFTFDGKGGDYVKAAERGGFECRAKAKIFHINADGCNFFSIQVKNNVKKMIYLTGDSKTRTEWNCN